LKNAEGASADLDAKDVGARCADGYHGGIDMPIAPHPPTERAASCAIAVMAKAPRPGAVKTRLAPPLALETASALSASFLRDITENIARAACGLRIHPYVAYAPARSAAFFDGMLAAGTRLVLADGAGVAAPGVGGLGRCLLHASQALFARGHDAVCLLNADSPTLPTALLAQAATALAADGDRVILGPAEDGGYYLIGMKAPHWQLFADVAWSTGGVARQTRQRAGALGLDVVELDPWYDVDDVPALHRLCRELATGRPKNGLDPFPAPATARVIARLGIAEILGAAREG
jgi:rSAM/selenodomain-associated transferase 1